MRISIDGPNRTTVTLANGTELYISYATCVGARIRGTGPVRTEVNHSRTTAKHLGTWRLDNAEKRPQEFFDRLLGDV